jgi:hypothetical protein
MGEMRFKILLKIHTWLKEKQYRRSKRRLENSIVALSKFDRFLGQSGLSRQERRYFWRQFGSNQKNREDILRKMCKQMGLRDFDKMTRRDAGADKDNEAEVEVEN